MTYEEALQYIHDTVKYGSKLGLQNITELLRRLGNPHHEFPAVHIAGTNGKGSVTAMTASILHKAGLRTGMFISPYLESFTERIQVNFQQIPGEHLARLTKRVKEEVRGMVRDGFNHPTEFEIVTTLGFLWFAEQKVDVAVVEVGLGGRLDSTNVIQPLVSIITSISYDHTRVLGSTLSEIAYEKGGIIKVGVPVVSYPQAEEAERVLSELAQERGSSYYPVSPGQIMERSSSFSEQRFDFTWKEEVLEDLSISLPGKHQLLNAACALSGAMIMRESGYEISDEAIYAGLKEARWPGRLEMIKDQPAVLLDGAHNPSGAQALADAVRHYFPDKRVHLILGVLGDKDVETVTRILCSIADRITLTEPDSHRAAPADELAAIAGKYHTDIDVCSDLARAIDKAMDSIQAGRGDMSDNSDKWMLVISGSLYLVGEARTILRSR
ncbi:MAG: bifunctional folylpolyglutamate synthase/dihydrofolate synthase [Caldicoprobacterales bacterium]|jgi:dihydrofolate synthase/folylpolyglutamate synthase|nr:bifunctional folylpolyglutamate synthase/dihydrofolate synthase [Clostridiales bacterium]